MRGTQLSAATSTRVSAPFPLYHPRRSESRQAVFIVRRNFPSSKFSNFHSKSLSTKYLRKHRIRAESPAIRPPSNSAAPEPRSSDILAGSLTALATATDDCRVDYLTDISADTDNSLSKLNLAASPSPPPSRCAGSLARAANNGGVNSSEETNVREEEREENDLLPVSPESLQYEAGYLGGISSRTVGGNRTGNGSGFRKGTGLEGLTDLPDMSDYLRKILTSKVYDVAIETPLDLAPKLSEKMENSVYLKREDMQQVFSFKLRGAYNLMAQLTREQLEKGVICSSAGNHAQGVALSAKRLNCSAVIAMPVTTPEIKWRSVQKLGAEVVLFGDSYDETQAYAKGRAESEGRQFIPPFDDPYVIAGQGTVGMEILRQHSGPLHAIFVPVGGGGLIAGIAAYVKSIRPEVRVIGVEPMDANAMAFSLHMGRRVQLEKVGGFADGVAVKVVGEETFKICKHFIDGVVLVSRDAICAAIKDMFEETRSILEPAGALSLAGAKAYCQFYGLENESVVAVTSGANMNFDRLRLVTELADVGARREAVLATALPETPGSFKKFAQLVGPSTNITEFKYRYASRDKAHVLYSIGLLQEKALSSLVSRMVENGFPTTDMSENELAKDHLRHLVGGKVSVPDEVLFRFVFPERPGALMQFLDMISPRWNITLFHYRRQGEMGANILVGVQLMPGSDEAEFTKAADALGYAYQDERGNEAYNMFMR